MGNNIKEVLDDLNIIYNVSDFVRTENEEDVKIDTYLINLSINNAIVRGGILENRRNNHVTILFFYDGKVIEEKLGYCGVLKIINEFNKTCVFGSFSYDDDVTYSLNIPAFGKTAISKNVFKYYFDYCIATVRDTFEELIDESRKDCD